MLDTMMKIAEQLLEQNLAPDWLTRLGIRRLLASRLAQESSSDIEQEIRRKMSIIANLRAAPIAVDQEKANEQHYEVPTAFFLLHLGKRMKYSSCYYETPDMSLDDAEDAMLRLYCERAGIKNGMTVLDLGCGWGSLSLYIAEHYRGCKVVGLSNSWTQREFIEGRAKERALSNVKIVTADVASIEQVDGGTTFDVVMSIEMFEHMRNYGQLLRKVNRWLKKGGKLFVHIFCHTRFIYCMETEGPTNWMGRYFFTGGTMPCDDVLTYFQDEVRLVDRWRVDGRHYAQTAEHWLQRFDANVDKIRPELRAAYGKEATKWEAYWRTFYLSVAELFGYRNGQEWHVAHYLFEKRQ